MGSSWDIVLWKRENSVSIVPSSWATTDEKTIYLWPHKLSKSTIDKLIKTCAAPSTDIDYIELEATFKKSAKTYEKAKHRELKYIKEGSESESVQDQYVSNEATSIDTLNTVLSELKEIKACLKDFIGLKEAIQSLSEEIYETKFVLNQICDTETSILRRFEVVKNNNVQNSTKIPFTMPIDNLNDLQTAEDVLTEDMKDILAQDFALVGGSNQRQFVTNMLRKLLSKDLAAQFSAKGKKSKLDFSKTKFFDVIIKAVRKQHQLTEVEITKMVSYSLANEGAQKKKKDMTENTIPEQNIDSTQRFPTDEEQLTQFL